MLIEIIELRRKFLDKFKTIIFGKLLNHKGKNIWIHRKATLNNPKKIYLDDSVKIYRGAYLNCRTERDDVGIKLGKHVKIHEYTYLDPYGGYIEFKDYSACGHHCVFGGHVELIVGKYTMISGLTYIVPANHGIIQNGTPYVLQPETKKSVIIGDNVWIGCGCVILAGVTIGNNSIIAAGSVVKDNVPENCLYAGVPAIFKRQLKANASI